jgi:hypothetical protein
MNNINVAGQRFQPPGNDVVMQSEGARAAE